MVSVTSASLSQSRSSMYIRGLINGNSTELAEAVPIVHNPSLIDVLVGLVIKSRIYVKTTL